MRRYKNKKRDREQSRQAGNAIADLLKKKLPVMEEQEKDNQENKEPRA